MLRKIVTWVQQLTDEAANALRLPADHSRVSMLASLRLMHEGLLEGLIAGERVDPAALSSITRTISELSTPPKKDSASTI